eukprot:2328244-Prymnesium_polylepis.1
MCARRACGTSRRSQHQALPAARCTAPPVEARALSTPQTPTPAQTRHALAHRARRHLAASARSAGQSARSHSPLL